LNGGPPSRFAAQVKTPWRVEDDVECWLVGDDFGFWILDFEWWIGGLADWRIKDDVECWMLNVGC